MRFMGAPLDVAQVRDGAKFGGIGSGFLPRERNFAMKSKVRLEVLGIGQWP